MDIGAIIAWFQANWVNITAVIGGMVTVASIIVKMTPTLKDDTFLLAVVKFLGKYIALNTNAPTEAERPK